MSTRRTLLVLLLPVLLVLGQQAALVHELGHTAVQAREGTAPGKQSHAGGYCEKCFGFSHLSAGSPTAPPAALAVPCAQGAPAAQRSIETRTEFSVRRTRGPPILL